MKSLWNEEDAAAAVERYAAQGVNADLALRTYSARLLGAEPKLVLHGGGNTSVKTRMTDVFGDEVEVLCVKGSGWDLATIEPPGHPAVRLAPLMRLKDLASLSDEGMVSAQRQQLLDPAAPNPSVETLLHAYMPEKFVDHTHSVAVLALADQPDSEAIFQAVWGGRVAVVPYVMPGFLLAKAAAAAREREPDVQGMVLVRHGLFTFGATARESYERMIALVTEAEDFIAARRKPAASARVGKPDVTALLPRLRGALAKAAGKDWPRRWIFDLRGSEAARRISDHPQLADLAARGVATPDHVIRTKRQPLVIDAAANADGAVAAFGADYRGYFARNNARVGGIKTALDPLPRLIAVPSLGLIGVGKSAAEASIAADIGESWAGTVLDAEDVGRFTPIGEEDTFEMEYWSLEQAKLSKAAEKPFARHIVVVTGGGGAIGAATAKAFAAQGAEVAVLDLDPEAAARAARAAGKTAVGIGCNVTDPQAVQAAFDQVVARFGGVDVVVSNAGVALTGMMAELDDETLRKSFELNFFAHQSVTQAAVKVMRAQGMGGVLLFNVSKQAINPGRDFGAYGASKAALLALVRQYALELGGEGIRVNGLNPDRIRSGLLTPEMIASRAASRGVSEAAYMAGNLLGEEVTAEDVADAFVAAALLKKTTGAVIPVDGGNVAAMLR